MGFSLIKFKWNNQFYVIWPWIFKIRIFLRLGSKILPLRHYCFKVKFRLQENVAVLSAVLVSALMKHKQLVATGYMRERVGN